MINAGFSRKRQFLHICYFATNLFQKFIIDIEIVVSSKERKMFV